MSQKFHDLVFTYLRLWHRETFAIDSTRAASLYRVFTCDKVSSYLGPLRWRQGRRLRLRPRHGAIYFIRGPSQADKASDVYYDARIWLREGGPSNDDCSVRFRALARFDRSKSPLFDDLVRCEIKLSDVWLVYYFNRLDVLSSGTHHSFLAATDVNAETWKELTREVAAGRLTPYPDVTLEPDFASYFKDYVIPGNVYWMTQESLSTLVLQLQMTFGPSQSLAHTYYARSWLLEYVNVGKKLVFARFTKTCNSCYNSLCQKGINLPAHVFNSYTLDQLIDHRCCK